MTLQSVFGILQLSHSLPAVMQIGQRALRPTPLYQKRMRRQEARGRFQ